MKGSKGYGGEVEKGESESCKGNGCGVNGREGVL